MVLRTVGIQCDMDLLHLLARTPHYSYLLLYHQYFVVIIC